jgi:hypothetical protein
MTPDSGSEVKTVVERRKKVDWRELLAAAFGAAVYAVIEFLAHGQR